MTPSGHSVTVVSKLLVTCTVSCYLSKSWHRNLTCLSSQIFMSCSRLKRISAVAETASSNSSLSHETAVPLSLPPLSCSCNNSAESTSSHTTHPTYSVKVVSTKFNLFSLLGVSVCSTGSSPSLQSTLSIPLVVGTCY